MKLNLITVAILALVLSCQAERMDPLPQADEPMDETNELPDSIRTFLALGDSYTIGESVAEEERWPVQLAKQLNDSTNAGIETVKIIARTGWTTNELQEQGIDQATLMPPYDLVSLLIGVNNQFRGYPIDQYVAEFESLLLKALAFAGDDTTRVFVVSIPDYGVTPFGSNRDPEKIARELDDYNEIAKGIADQYGIRFFNITEISREAKDNPTLIAEDGLHPSGEMYRRWVEVIFPWAKEILEE